MSSQTKLKIGFAVLGAVCAFAFFATARADNPDIEWDAPDGNMRLFVSPEAQTPDCQHNGGLSYIGIIEPATATRLTSGEMVDAYLFHTCVRRPSDLDEFLDTLKTIWTLFDPLRAQRSYVGSYVTELQSMTDAIITAHRIYTPELTTLTYSIQRIINTARWHFMPALAADD